MRKYLFECENLVEAVRTILVITANTIDEAHSVAIKTCMESCAIGINYEFLIDLPEASVKIPDGTYFIYNAQQPYESSAEALILKDILKKHALLEYKYIFRTADKSLYYIVEATHLSEACKKAIDYKDPLRGIGLSYTDRVVTANLNVGYITKDELIKFYSSEEVK